MTTPDGDLIEISKTIRRNAERAVALLAYFSAGNRDDISAALEGDEVTPAMGLVRGAVIESLCLALSRIADGARDKHSLASAASRMKGPIPDWVPPMARAAWVEFLTATDSAIASDPVIKLRKFRDYSIAHSIPQKWDPGEGYLLDEALEAMDLLLRAAFLLGVATGTVTVSRQAVEETWAKRSEVLFRRITQLPRELPRAK